MMLQCSKEARELWKKYDACKDKAEQRKILKQIDELSAKEIEEQEKNLPF